MSLSAHLSDSPKPVVLIGGGPGAWDLITVRGMHALQEADVILTDHLGPAPELDKFADLGPLGQLTVLHAEQPLSSSKFSTKVGK